MARATLLFCVLIVALSSVAHGLIHHLSVVDDTRSVFRIETFGFEEGGTISMAVTGFKLGGVPASSKVKSAFVIKHTETDSSAFIDETDSRCSFEDDSETPDGDYPRHPESADFKDVYNIKPGAEGFYSVIFVNCEEDKAISFELELEMYNPGPNYLSAGLSPLPTMYFLFDLVYIGAFLAWVFYFMRGEGKKVFRIHHLMTMVIALKILSLLFKAIEYHFKKTTGHPGAWAVAYYVFAALKTITMFMVIALIGTGWAFIKPFLSEKDKKIFMVVLPLQVVANVAMIILEETAPGSSGWFTWKEIFRLVDIVCCGAILVPIIWSIKHLRDAAQIDGKAQRNMEKLKLFRQFYLLVVTYIYFTRIIVYLMDATLPFRWVWLGEFFTELATLGFWAITCYKFRPVPDNPYFRDLSDDEGQDDEQPEISEESSQKHEQKGLEIN